MSTRPDAERKAILSWALYDWGNSAFALLVVSVFFPVFLKQYWTATSDVTYSTLLLGIANAVAAILVAVVAPVAGAMADRHGTKKRSLAACAAVAICATAALALVGRGNVALALTLFVVASIGFAASNIFYDALLPDVAGSRPLHSISALGFGLGYLGGGLLFAATVAATVWPAHLGLADSSQAIRLSFLAVAVWWAVFTLPLLLNVREDRVGIKAPLGHLAAGMLVRLRTAFRELRSRRAVWIFLLAYWCYIDGVTTMARMAVDYGMDLGFKPADLVTALLVTQFIGFPASLLLGYFGDRIGAKPVLYAGVAAYGLAAIWSFRMTELWEFYALAATIGLVQGGVQALSRSYYTQLFPAGRAGEFFGFFNMSGRLAAVLGPAVVGVVTATTGNPRLSLLAILLFFLAGAGLLSFVDDDDGAP